MHYDFHAIEKHWQDYWEQHKTFRTLNPGQEGFDPSRPKYYVLAMFPYPSGAGMHMGHALNYTSTDIVARYKRMAGYHVLHPIGFDSFGLPAEQYAVEKGIHPRVTTQQNIGNITTQFRRLGLGFDWDRCFSTTDRDYYRWTQWIFLQLYHSYVDPETGCAAPIEQLRRRLESGEYDVGPGGELIKVSGDGMMDALGGVEGVARKWIELEPDQQRSLLNEYRLAYMAEVPVNWCPALGTVLANEEVTNEGRSDRGNHPVYRRPLRQWTLRITAYSERLLADLEPLDWPEPIKLMQRNWIGRSDGAEVDFAIDDTDQSICVFTTRPDTLFGATYMVLAPEHPLVEDITTPSRRDTVAEYQRLSAAKSEIDRQTQTKKKTGEFTGAHAINPANGQRIPIWIADYVMMGYGTGAIMAVPAHDDRDHEFAQAFHLPIVPVVRPPAGTKSDHNIEAFIGDGTSINSAHSKLSLNGLPTAQAKHVIAQWLTTNGYGRPRTQYKLRDWLFSRQRYWGEPFPILHGDGEKIIAVEPEDLPVELPELDDFKPRSTDDPDAAPSPPLDRAPTDWKNPTINGAACIRELNTMPQWAGSCWYYLRFCDTRNHEEFVGREMERFWMSGHGVDLYVGGVEHAVLHLLYARFWHKVLYDLGHASTPEPFGRLFNQGYIQEDAFRDERGVVVDAFEVTDSHGRPALELDRRQRQTEHFFYHNQPVQRIFGKMGKSLKNSVTPDKLVEQYGADTLRLFLMYLGPLDQSKPWNPKDIIGIERFLKRLWRNYINEESGDPLVDDHPASDPLRRQMHRTVQRVTDAMETMSFNIAIAALIEFNNELVHRKRIPRDAAETLVLCLSPMAPHISEQLWRQLGADGSIADAEWPKYDPELLVEDRIELPVQVNGKVRGRIIVPADAKNDTIEQAALADGKVAVAIAGKTVRKVIVVKGRLVNLVAQ